MSDTFSILGQQAKLAFPGEYDDLDDADLGKRIQSNPIAMVKFQERMRASEDKKAAEAQKPGAIMGNIGAIGNWTGVLADELLTGGRNVELAPEGEEPLLSGGIRLKKDLGQQALEFGQRVSSIAGRGEAPLAVQGIAKAVKEGWEGAPIAGEEEYIKKAFAKEHPKMAIAEAVAKPVVRTTARVAGDPIVWTMGAAGPVLGTAAGAAFVPGMVKGGAESLESGREKWEAGDKLGAIEDITQGGLDLTLAAGGAKHTAGRLRKAGTMVSDWRATRARASAESKPAAAVGAPDPALPSGPGGMRIQEVGKNKLPLVEGTTQGPSFLRKALASTVESAGKMIGATLGSKGGYIGSRIGWDAGARATQGLANRIRGAHTGEGIRENPLRTGIEPNEFELEQALSPENMRSGQLQQFDRAGNVVNKPVAAEGEPTVRVGEQRFADLTSEELAAGTGEPSAVPGVEPYGMPEGAVPAQAPVETPQARLKRIRTENALRKAESEKAELDKKDAERAKIKALPPEDQPFVQEMVKSGQYTLDQAIALVKKQRGVGKPQPPTPAAVPSPAPEPSRAFFTPEERAQLVDMLSPEVRGEAVPGATDAEVAATVAAHNQGLGIDWGQGTPANEVGRALTEAGVPQEAAAPAETVAPAAPTKPRIKSPGELEAEAAGVGVEALDVHPEFTRTMVEAANGQLKAKRKDAQTGQVAEYDVSEEQARAIGRRRALKAILAERNQAAPLEEGTQGPGFQLSPEEAQGLLKNLPGASAEDIPAIMDQIVDRLKGNVGAVRASLVKAGFKPEEFEPILQESLARRKAAPAPAPKAAPEELPPAAPGSKSQLPALEDTVADFAEKGQFTLEDLIAAAEKYSKERPVEPVPNQAEIDAAQAAALAKPEPTINPIEEAKRVAGVIPEPVAPEVAQELPPGAAIRPIKGKKVAQKAPSKAAAPPQAPPEPVKAPEGQKAPETAPEATGDVVREGRYKGLKVGEETQDGRTVLQIDEDGYPILSRAGKGGKGLKEEAGEGGDLRRGMLPSEVRLARQKHARRIRQEMVDKGWLTPEGELTKEGKAALASPKGEGLASVAEEFAGVRGQVRKPAEAETPFRMPAATKIVGQLRGEAESSTARVNVRRANERTIAEIESRNKRHPEAVAAEAEAGHDNSALSPEQQRITDNTTVPLPKPEYKLPAESRIGGETPEEGLMSVGTWRGDITRKMKSGRDAFIKQAKRVGLTQKEIDRALDGIDFAALLAEMKPDMMPRDTLYNIAGGKLSAVRPNLDFGTSLDFDTNCPRAVGTNALIDAIQKQSKTVLTRNDRIALQLMLRQGGLTPECLYCYALEGRLKAADFAKRATTEGFTLAKGKPHEKTWGPIEEKYLVDEEAARNAPPEKKEHIAAARKYIMGAKANVVKPFTPYQGEYLSEKNLPKEMVDRVNARWGMRLNSNTDFKPYHALDLMQAIADASTRGIKMHVYTKELDMLLGFGDTGIKFNLSLAGNGDGRGGIKFDARQGMDPEVVKWAHKNYRNAGGMLVALDKDAVVAAMRPENEHIGQIIPGHLGLTKGEQAALGWESQKGQQHERPLTSGELRKGQKPGKGSVQREVHKDDLETFLGACEKKGLRPRFAEYVYELDKNGHIQRGADGLPIRRWTGTAGLKNTSELMQKAGVKGWDDPRAVQKYGAKMEQGYMKLVRDFARVDTPFDGVKPKFNTKHIEKTFKDWLDEGVSAEEVPVDQKMVDEFLKLRSEGRLPTIDKPNEWAIRKPLPRNPRLDAAMKEKSGEVPPEYNEEQIRLQQQGKGVPGKGAGVRVETFGDFVDRVREEARQLLPQTGEEARAEARRDPIGFTLRQSVNYLFDNMNRTAWKTEIGKRFGEPYEKSGGTPVEDVYKGGFINVEHPVEEWTGMRAVPWELKKGKGPAGQGQLYVSRTTEMSEVVARTVHASEIGAKLKKLRDSAKAKGNDDVAQMYQERIQNLYDRMLERAANGDKATIDSLVKPLKERLKKTVAHELLHGFRGTADTTPFVAKSTARVMQQRMNESAEAMLDMPTPEGTTLRQELDRYFEVPSMENAWREEIQSRAKDAIEGYGTIENEYKRNTELRLKQISPEQAARIKMKTTLPDTDEFRQMVANTPGASAGEEGLRIDLVRFQKPEQAGEQSVRTGVFYLPRSSRKTGSYQTTRRGAWEREMVGQSGNTYGGTEKITGETVLRNPLVVAGATGGKAPEAAFERLKGKLSVNRLWEDTSAISDSYNMSTKETPELVSLKAELSELNAKSNRMGFPENKRFDADRRHLLEAIDYERRQIKKKAVEDLLEKYGADKGLANEIIYNSQDGNQLGYALRENIIAHAVRDAGYDSVVGYSKTRKGPRIDEVFDVREVAYPVEGEEGMLHPKFEEVEEAVGLRQEASEGSELRGGKKLSFAEKMKREGELVGAAGKTAIARTKPSTPANAWVEHVKGKTVFDWGAGKGADMGFYKEAGASDVKGYDPNHMPEKPEGMADVVTNTYVANVLPPKPRQSMWIEAFARAKDKMLVSVRSDQIKGEPYEDGVVTSAGTFQKSYKPGELVEELKKLFPGATVEAGPKVSGASTAIVTREKSKTPVPRALTATGGSRSYNRYRGTGQGR